VVFFCCCYDPRDAYAATPPAEFAEHSIASGLKGGYQVVIARPEQGRQARHHRLGQRHDGAGLVRKSRVETPRLATDLTRMINLAAWDTDGDGIPEIVLAHEFANEAKNSIGILSVLSTARIR
jgi:hypothetical protein